MEHRGVTSVVLASLVAIGTSAWAQTTVPAPATPASPGASPAAGSGGTLAVVGVIVALLVLVGIGVKLFDLKRKRTAEAIHLQAQVSDALLREESLVGLAITPTAHVPFLGGGPATIEVTGTAPTHERRETALRVVEREASRVRPDVRVVDRLHVGDGLERVA